MSEIFGIECRDHYGNPTYDFPSREVVPMLVYRIVRSTHNFLDNHNHSCKVVEPDCHGKWGRIIIHYPDSDKAWFTQEYRVVTRETVDRDIAEYTMQLSRLRETRDRQRDTVRGRKERLKCIGMIDSVKRQIDAHKSKWPKYMGLERSEWQQSLHDKGMI